MFFVGIDIAKRNHEAAIVDDQGRIVQKAFGFQNSCDGFNKLLSHVLRITNAKSQVVFGMESTSHYWLALYTRLMKDGYQVHVFNPMQSDSLRGMYIRQNKTDSRDSFIIAEVLRFGKYSTARVPQDKILALREMCRNRYFMIDSVSDLKRKVTALIDQIFPEYETLFCDIFGITSMQLLTKYPSPEKIRLAKPSSITNLLLKASNGRFGQAKMLEVKELAKNTFGVEDTNGVYSDLIQCYMEQIKFIHQQINVLDLKIKAISDTIDSHITSIPGIGPVLGATILAEIGDISRFSSSDKLAAFAGVDPTVKQSGDFVGVKNHMSKRGTPYLRRALWMASTIAVRFDPMFRAYHEKKAAEGMRYMKIMGHVTKKMTAVIFAVLRDNKEYQPVLQTAKSA